jgi:hypothetical protein
MGRPSKSTTAIGLLLWLALVLLVQGQQGGPSPALYMFGDSQLDVGNNNYVLTSQLLFKANHPRYGVDYPGGVATGRFSNGRNLADFIGTSTLMLLVLLYIALDPACLLLTLFCAPTNACSCKSGCRHQPSGVSFHLQRHRKLLHISQRCQLCLRGCRSLRPSRRG